MEKFEYKAITRICDNKEWIERLNEEGQSGWEVVSEEQSDVPDFDNTTWRRALLKRKITP